MKKTSTFLFFFLLLMSLNAQNVPSPFIGTNLTRGDNLLILRLAVSCTGEYTQSVGGAAQAKANMTAWLNTINETYGREYSVRFELIPNNDQLIFPDPTTDPWPAHGPVGDACQRTRVFSDLQATVIDNVIGAANYDFSHIITSGTLEGGCAGRYKFGVSGTFNIPITRHEMGHQFSQPHTINNGNATNYEPENAGRTIQGSNVAPHGHATSFQHLANTILNTPNIGRQVPTNNTIPTVNAGVDRFIPVSTPFTMTAVAIDPDAGDNLTYVWDQMDGATMHNLPPPDDRQGALFSRFLPTPNASRTFPSLANVLANNYSNTLEHLPTQARGLNFRVTVNDNHKITYQGNQVNASGINSDDVRVTIVNNGGAFSVTSPNTAVIFQGGSVPAISWNVAGTDQAPINTANVKISLSTDGGQTFPIVLANSTPNDGTENLRMPNINTTTAIIKIEAVGNIYFDISNQNFTINQNPAIAGINVTTTGNTTIVNETGQTDTYTLTLLSNPTGPVTIAITADAQTEISTDGTTFAPNRVVVLNNTTPQTVTVRGRYDNVTEGPHLGTVTQIVTATGDNANYPVGLLGEPVTVNISDAQVPPVVAIDFDVPNAGNVPANWRRMSLTRGQNPTVENDIPLDDGTPTNIDFSVSIADCGVGGCAFAWAPSPALPRHIQSLANFGGVTVARGNFQSTWSSLKPNTRYRIFVFMTGAFGTINQTVTILGNGTDNPAPFVQTAAPNELRINDQLSTTQPLLTFGKMVTSTNNGTIMVNITPNAAGGEMNVSAMAIQEVVGPPANVPTPCPAGLATSIAPVIQIVNSTCAAGQTVPSGGRLVTPNGCVPGTTLQFSTDNGANWNPTLPAYNQTTVMTVLTRCNCNADNGISSQSATAATTPGACAAPPACPPNLVNFAAPQVMITNNTCATGQTPAQNGSITAPMGCPPGTTIQYTTDQEVTWSNTLPNYDPTTNQFVDTRCVCNMDNTVFSPTTLGETVPVDCDGGAPPIAGDGGIGGAESWCVDEARFSIGPGQIAVRNLIAEREIIEIIGAGTNWQVVKICDGDCAESQIINNLTPGSYQVKLQMFDSSDDSYCFREVTLEVFGDNAPPRNGVANCNDIQFLGGNGQILLNNLTAQREKIEILGQGTNWQVVPICEDNCDDSHLINNLAAGVYTVKLQMWGDDGSYCYREEEVVVGATGDGNGNPPIAGDGGTINCDGVQFSGSEGQITLSNLTAQYEKIEILGRGTDWEVIPICFNDCNDPQVINNLGAGSYEVKLTMVDNDGSACYRQETVQVTAGNVAPPNSSRISQNIRLTGFEKEQAIEVQWVHATDLKKRYYVLEKSIDGQHFEQVVIKKAETANLEVHNDLDKNPNDGDNFYRVFTQFEDGMSTYSAIVNVPYKKLKHFSLFPNPIPQNGELSLNLKEYEGLAVNVMIHNSLGQQMLQFDLAAIPDASIKIQLKDYESGLYALTVKVKGKALQSKTFMLTRL